MLQNGNFEGPFVEHKQYLPPHPLVGEYWVPWFIEGRDHGYPFRPEYKPEFHDQGSGRVLQGNTAQKMFTTHAPHEGGFYQVVSGLVAGKWYRFTGHVWIWSSEHNDPNVSRDPGKVLVALGVNPWADPNPQSYQTLWGKGALDKYDQWVQLHCIFRAWGDRACLFTLSQPEYPVNHNDAYWDVFSLEPYNIEEPEPEPPPTGECRFVDNTQEILDALATALEAGAAALRN